MKKSTIRNATVHGLLFAGLISAATQASAVTEVFSIDYHDGARYDFVLNRTLSGSDGYEEVQTDRPLSLQFSTVNEQIGTETANMLATLTFLDGGAYPEQFQVGEDAYTYFKKTDEGLYLLREGYINQHSYRQFSPAQPFFLNAPIAVGQTLSFSGDVEGDFNDETDPNPWVGNWSMDITNLGEQEIVVGGQTHTWTQFRMTATEYRDTLSGGWTSVTRFVDDYYFDDVAGWMYLSTLAVEDNDQDRDGVTDFTWTDKMTMERVAAVPEPSNAALFVAGLGLTWGMRKRRMSRKNHQAT